MFPVSDPLAPLLFEPSLGRREFANVVQHYASMVELMQQTELGLWAMGGDDRRAALGEVIDRLRESERVSASARHVILWIALEWAGPG